MTCWNMHVIRHIPWFGPNRLAYYMAKNHLHIPTCEVGYFDGFLSYPREPPVRDIGTSILLFHFSLYFRLKQANSIRRRVHGKVQEDAAMGTPGTWRKNRGAEHRDEFQNISLTETKYDLFASAKLLISFLKLVNSKSIL